MNKTNQSCKGCNRNIRVTSEQIERVLASAMFAQIPCADDREYEQRLAACAQCPKLLDGTTCMICGCIVQIVAKYKVRTCPYPGLDRWANEPINASKV